MWSLPSCFGSVRFLCFWAVHAAVAHKLPSSRLLPVLSTHVSLCLLFMHHSVVVPTPAVHVSLGPLEADILAPPISAHCSAPLWQPEGADVFLLRHGLRRLFYTGKFAKFNTGAIQPSTSRCIRTVSFVSITCTTLSPAPKRPRPHVNKVSSIILLNAAFKVPLYQRRN